jgi:hypothetical protein
MTRLGFEQYIDFSKKTWKNQCTVQTPRKTPIKKITVIVEYHQEDNTTISNPDTLTTQLSKILVQGLTSKEKDLKPFWAKQSEEISRKLRLPTKTDYQDSVTSKDLILEEIHVDKFNVRLHYFYLISKLKLFLSTK